MKSNFIFDIFTSGSRSFPNLLFVLFWYVQIDIWCFIFWTLLFKKRNFIILSMAKKYTILMVTIKLMHTSINLKYLGIDPNRQLHSLEENPMYPMKGMNRNTYVWKNNNNKPIWYDIWYKSKPCLSSFTLFRISNILKLLVRKDQSIVCDSRKIAKWWKDHGKLLRLHQLLYDFYTPQKINFMFLSSCSAFPTKWNGKAAWWLFFMQL